MKYYLIIGYQSLEKFRQYTRMQVFLNDIMLEDFDLNSEDSISNIFQNSSITDKTTLADAIHNSKQSKTNLDTSNDTLVVEALKKYRRELQKKRKVRNETLEKAETLLFKNLDIMLKQKMETMDHEVKDAVMKILAKHVPERFLKMFNNTYDKKHYLNNTPVTKDDKLKSTYRVCDTQPKKLKILQIDSTAFNTKKVNKLTFHIKGGPSNDTNGFISKRNMAIIFPVFLVPKIIFNKKMLDRVFEGTKKYYLGKKYTMNSYPFYFSAEAQFPQPNKNGTYTLKDKPLQWPGLNYMPIDTRSNDCMMLGQPFGEDLHMNFWIHQKHKIFSIHTSPNVPRGRWQLNLCFVNMFDLLAKSLG